MLARQHLLVRATEDAIEVLDRCVGMPSQDPQAPFYGLWSRISEFRPAELDELMDQHEVVRTVLLRGALWLMDGHDARWMRALCQPMIEHHARANHQLTAAEPASVVAAAGDLLAGRELPAEQLRAELAQRWPDEAPGDLLAVAHDGLPLVQVPPRGLWGRGGTVTLALLDDWIGSGEPAVTGEEALADLIRMYLRGYGPASAAGLQSWSGLTGLDPVLTAMARDWELAEYTGPDGEHLYDLEGLGLADPDQPAPVRFLAPFDHLLIASADRARVCNPSLYRRTITLDGRSPGFVLVDGMLAATWSVADGRVEIDYLREVTAPERDAVVEESRSLAAFALDSAG